MPIEIRELVIKATIDNNNGNSKPNNNTQNSSQKKVDINEIVTLVFEKVKEKMER